MAIVPCAAPNPTIFDLGSPAAGQTLALSRRSFLAGASALAALTLAPSITLAAPKTRLISDLVARPHPRMGLAFPGNRTGYYSALSGAGLGIARLNVQWKVREPSPGEFGWIGLDTRVTALIDQGIEPFLTFTSDAEWAIRPETAGINNGTPQNLDDWHRFVATTAERYADRVRYFQVANEWDGTHAAGGWLGTTEELIDYVNTAYDAVKSNAPEAVFVLGGISSDKLDFMAVYEGRADYDVVVGAKVRTPDYIRGEQWIADLIENHIYPVLRESNYDMADLHLYGPVERDPVRIASMRDQVAGFPLLSSECGGPSLYYDPEFPLEQHFFEVLERNLQALDEGLEFCLWFGLAENEEGARGNSKVALFDLAQQPKPGYFAYQLLAQVLVGMETVERVDGIQAYWIHRDDGSKLLIGWGEGSVELPDGFTPARVAQVTDPISGTFTVRGLGQFAALPLQRLPAVVGV